MKKNISLYIDERVLDSIEEERGEYSRNGYIRHLIKDKLKDKTN